MKKVFIIFYFLLLTSFLFSEEARFMKYPDIHKDKIVFTYEGDLWIANINGGNAIRITSFPGNEYAAKFSPDGKYIAFTANYDGSQNVYLMPSEGGDIKRLTYSPGGVQTVAWTPDSKKIIFRSMMEIFIGRDPKLYSIGVDGNSPETLPIDRGRLCSFSSDGSKMLYTRKGDEEYYWKRYKGGRYVDIWMYDFKTKNFTPISDYVGKNAYPMWVENKMFFTSDRANDGITNIFVQDLTTKEIKQLTSFSDFDVMQPSTDGNNIVFIHDGYIKILNLKTNEIKKVTINIISDRWQLRPRYINPKDYIHSISISNDINKLSIEARGDIFYIDKNKSTNLSSSSDTRERYPQISPDGKWIAYFSDKTGEYQLYIKKIDGSENIQLTNNLNKTVYKLIWSPDSKKILFGDKEFTLYYIDIQTKKLTKIDQSNQLKNDEFYWEISDYNWSPDSKWICYSLVQYNRNSQIFIYNTETNKKYAITDDFYDNLYPSFDKNGKYLYYISSRNFDVQMDFYEDNHIINAPQQIMIVQLQDNEPSPFDEQTGEKETKTIQNVKIDFENIIKRTYPLPTKPGNYFYLKAGNGKVAWLSIDKFTEDEYEEIFKPGGRPKWDLHIFDIQKSKETIITDKVSDFNLSPNGENIIIKKAIEYFVSNINKIFETKTLGDKVNLDDLIYYVEPQKEWIQIFNDAWRWYRDFFYDPDMHGRDWNKIGEKYKSYIKDISSRSELNWVIEQMVGELCVSHTYISGGDFNQQQVPQSPIYTGWLGADLTPDEKAGYYKFAKIYGPTPQNLNLKSPLSSPEIKIQEGYYLLAINDKELKVPDNYWKYLQTNGKDKIKITINDKPTFVNAKTYEIKLIQNSSNLRYFRWLADNIEKVEKATNGRVGYMHINAMGSGGIGEFDKFWRAFRYKDGIIIDVRRNSGGWTEYFMIDKLERKVVAFNVLKNMVPFRYPGSAGNGNYVAISNEYNGSDGEAFIQHFKARNLGKVIGVPSWGGLVGIVNGQTTIDNGTIQQSNNSFYGKEGTWWVENHGADPDIYIDNDPSSVMSGKDPQLDKAIEVILENAKTIKIDLPERPPYPKK
ncbi:MAG TPA: S41 family peptidase [Bacteroidota bacterium]|nr:S41 family peptidase [Bacteroidota bacterium]